MLKRSQARGYKKKKKKYGLMGGAYIKTERAKKQEEI